MQAVLERITILPWMLKWAVVEEHEGKFSKRVMQSRPKRNAHGDDIWRIQRQYEDVRGCWVHGVQQRCRNWGSNITAGGGASAEYHRSEIRFRCSGSGNPDLTDRLAKRRSAAEMQLSVKML